MSVRIEPDRGRTPFHRRIVRTKPIANTKTGQVCDLECGHVVQTFGDLNHAAGVVLCTECRNEAADSRPMSNPMFGGHKA